MTLQEQNDRLKQQLVYAVVALEFYSKQRHFDIHQGRTMITDNGGVAADALEKIEDLRVSGQ